MVKYLGGYFKADDFLVGSKETVKEKFRLSKDIWTMFPHADNDILYRCDACGCETHLDTMAFARRQSARGRCAR